VLVCSLAFVMTACESSPESLGKSPAASWTRSTFHGAGLTITFDHPPTWKSQLRGRGFHYSATFGFLANFGLHQFCGSPASGPGCLWRVLGPFPPNGVLMTFGTFGYGPGDESQAQLLGPGAAMMVNSRVARRSVGTGEGCLGTGANSSLSYRMVDGQTQGAFAIDFCGRGPNVRLLESEADRVARSLHISPGPAGEGARPD